MTTTRRESNRRDSSIEPMSKKNVVPTSSSSSSRIQSMSSYIFSSLGSWTHKKTSIGVQNENSYNSPNQTVDFHLEEKLKSKLKGHRVRSAGDNSAMVNSRKENLLYSSAGNSGYGHSRAVKTVHVGSRSPSGSMTTRSSVGVEERSTSFPSSSTAASTRQTAPSPTPSNSKAAPAAAASSSSSSSTTKPLCCDKCDGKHETADCPYFKKGREEHPDAQKNSKDKLGGTSLLPGSLIKNGRVVRQPGDGSCLFHSMCYGLGGGNASRLRSEICAFIQRNPTLKISDTPLKDWVKWDSGYNSVQEYARHMSNSAWGGGIEMACVSHMKGCNVHVYERGRLGFKRISAFDNPASPETKKTIRVLYGGGVHYDALIAS